MLAAVFVAVPTSARAADCPNASATTVPGAERADVACLDDLTTRGTVVTGHTDQSDWEGLNARGTQNPPGPIPGLQVDGYFPDTSTSNATHGWMHDSQFVIRLPNDWNGKLIVTGAPGIRRQYSPDFLISDWAVARGYAYASTDKGNGGTAFYADGTQPGDAIAEWHARVTELTRAAKQTVAARYGRAPERTYMTGLSNGGYLTRWQLENHPELYDGGVDWEGTLVTPDRPANLLAYLPVALRNYPRYRATGDAAAHDAMIAAGFAPGSEFLWADHYATYWDLTQRTYREEWDPDFDGPLQAGIPFCQSGTPSCDADYDPDTRPGARAAIARTALTGRIGKPMLTLHGTLDSLLPQRIDSDIYSRMVDASGRGDLHRYYVIEAGNHVDGRYDSFPDRLRPIAPCYRTAFLDLERWVERGDAPPDSQYVPKPASGDVVNACALATRATASGGPVVPRSTKRRPAPRALSARVKRRDRRRLTVNGRLSPPAGTTRAAACAPGGNVRIRVTTTRPRDVALRPNCSYRATVRINARARARVRLNARFLGNRALRPRSARTRSIRLR
jgi:hypothetical protein